MQKFKRNEKYLELPEDTACLTVEGPAGGPMKRQAEDWRKKDC